MRKLTLLAAAAVLATAAAGAGITSALAVSSSSDQAPECVHITVQAAQSDGTVRSLHYEFCGSGPGGDSALHDYVNHHRFVLDGGGLPGRDCGGWADPCVIFPR